MEIKTKLIMTFKTDDDKTVAISLENPRTDLTEEEIKGAMELIISKAIFAPNGSSLIALGGAKVVQTDTTEYDLAL